MPRERAPPQEIKRAHDVAKVSKYERENPTPPSETPRTHPSTLNPQPIAHQGVRTQAGQLRRQSFDLLDDAAGARRRILRRTLAACDLVGLVDRFDETLLLLADLTGLQHLLYTRSAPRSTNPKMTPPTIDAMCPDLEACKRHISAVAPVDRAIYMEAVDAFDAKVKALGAPFQERLKQFRAVQQAYAKRSRKIARRSTAYEISFGSRTPGDVERSAAARATIARRSTADEASVRSRTPLDSASVNMEGVGCRFGETKEAWGLCREIIADASVTRHWLFTRKGCCERLRACSTVASRALRVHARGLGSCRGWRREPKHPRGRGRWSANISDEECARECSNSPDWDRALTQACPSPAPLLTPHPLPY